MNRFMANAGGNDSPGFVAHSSALNLNKLNRSESRCSISITPGKVTGRITHSRRRPFAQARLAGQVQG